MKYQFPIAAILAAASTVSAGPIITARQAINDVEILNYALTLEHLEATFYRQGLANFTHAQFLAAGFEDPFYQNLQEVACDEETHVTFLTGALGSAAVAECIYNFPCEDVNGFVALASILEGVGVSAYLGAAASISDKSYLTDAGSILTVEARHNSYLRASLGESPFPSPFDIPLDFDEVYTLAAPFIAGCPATNAALPFLPVKAFPALTLVTTGTITVGTTIIISTPGTTIIVPGGVVYAAFITIKGPIFVVATPCNGGYSVVVPSGLSGQNYVVLTGCDEALSDVTITAGPLILEIC